MKKRTGKKYSFHRKSRTNSSYYIAIVTLMLVLAFAGKRVYEGASGEKVLGTSVFLAEEGPPQEPPKQESQPQQQQPNRQNPEQRQQGQFQQVQQTGGQQQTQQKNDDRTRPEFQRSQPSSPEREKFEQQFKEEATKNGFQFNGQLPERFQQFRQAQHSGEPGSPNNSGSGSQNQGLSNQRGPSQFQALPPANEFPALTGRFEVRSENNTNINLNDANTRIELGNKNANFELKARRPDGREVQIDKSAFEKINAAMQVVTGAQIEQNGEKIVFKRGDVTAHAALPLSFNLSTKTFTVQTSAGEKELHVLPDEAVEKLIKNKVITQVTEDTAKDDSGVQLKEFKNKPVFEVKGTKQKKFLFFVPVTVSKTSLVSAETGEVVNTNQGLVSQVLETISF